MRRTTPAVLALLLVTSALAAVPAAVAQQTEPTPTNGTATERIAPGAQLSGVVGVQGAELNGEVESRAYGVRLAQANSDNATAAVVAAQLNATEQRLTELEAERRGLEEARANGSMSESEYRARTATLYARSQSAQRLATRTNETASDLPEATLEANGVNASAIRSLSERAATLTGPEMAAIARPLDGPDVGADSRPVTPDDASASFGGTDRTGGPARPDDTATRPDNSTNATPAPAEPDRGGD